MKIYLPYNVWDAALGRIRWLFSEFPNIIVAFSGGKDSTVVLNLALMVAKELGRLPLKVMWIDQEAEWQSVRDYVRTVMDRPEVEPWWFQIPMVLANSTSSDQDWLECWDPKAEAEWMRPKEPDAITKNTFGTKRFGELFDAIIAQRFAGQPACVLGGVRTEESPSRFAALTAFETYKRATWGKRLNGKKSGHFTMYPLYDWSYRDIWKAIHDNRWAYCRLYDAQYQHGIPIQDMRVSNVHHETAVGHLQYLQDVEPDTWNKLTKRLKGINTVKKMGRTWTPDTLPPMFKDWVEYREHLLRNIITVPEQRAAFRKTFDSMDRRYAAMHHLEFMHKAMVQSILGNDYHGTRLKNWENKPDITAWRQHQAGKRHHLHAKKQAHHRIAPMNDLQDAVRAAFVDAPDKIAFLEELRDHLHRLSPLKGQPVDRVRWVPIEKVQANDYNPNSVARVEMRLLYTSILHDGYTQPIVTVHDAELDRYVIVDGFHRYFTAKSNPDILARNHGRVPVVVIDKSINDRMASTVRHNRARGTHSITGMSSMVFSMLENGWEDAAICNELGMEAEELLRLKHVTGFSKLFENTEYRKAWVTKRQILIEKGKPLPPSAPRKSSKP